MPYVDHTAEFRNLAREKSKEYGSKGKAKAFARPDNNTLDPLSKEYLAEAYNVLNHIKNLNKMLLSIRKPYLDVSSRPPPLSRKNAATFGETEPWSNVKYLSNEERDQIDMQARTILSRCSDRVKEMEALEKRRAELVAGKTNPLARLLPARLRQDASSMTTEFIAAHHSSITWYLSRRLTEASQTQKEMQEERVKREQERTRTLGSGAALEAISNIRGQAPDLNSRQTSTDSDSAAPPGSWSSNLIASAIGAPSPGYGSASSSFYTQTQLPPEELEEEDDELELSEAQMQQFEQENADMLRSVQNTLQAVRQAESRLLDISALQMELVSHLTRQTELTDQLYEDAIATTSMVEKGNAQLREARRRSKDGRLFVLVFLIGASISLLFLHYY